MKLNITLIQLLLLGSLFSCSDDGSVEPKLEVEEFVSFLYARPNDGDILGQISTDTELTDLRFDLVDQEPMDALSIDPSTGELSVADSDIFDINFHELIRADIEVSSGELRVASEVRINLRLEEAPIAYFKEIALGFENGIGLPITRKWDIPMKIYLDGNPSTALINKVEETISTINDLTTDGFAISLVDTSGASNCYMFFGSREDYLVQFPESASLLEGNLAIFQVWWDGDNFINRARIFIDTENPTSTQQESLVLEEITQSLGLGKDSGRYPNSIFYETSTDGGFATSYSDFDLQVIRMLYDFRMTVGLPEFMVDPILRDIQRSYW